MIIENITEKASSACGVTDAADWILEEISRYARDSGVLASLAIRQGRPSTGETSRSALGAVIVIGRHDRVIVVIGRTLRLAGVFGHE